jgi:solute carrier family 27 fatty acid transporter 1/4
VKIVLETLPRDLKGIYYYLKMERQMLQHASKKNTIGSIFHTVVKKYPHKTAFVNVESGEKFTFTEIEKLANQFGNYFLSQGLKKGDVVALMLNNRPEYVAIWLGLSKIGVVTALLNTNLRSDSLAHCIKLSKAANVIIGCDHQKIYEEDMKKGYLDSSLRLFVFGEDALLPGLKAENLKELIKTASAAEPPKNKEINFKTVLIYIYTSGTTGLPKAAVFTHSRYYMAACGPGLFMGVKPHDVFYSVMPLYHTAGGVMGIGSTMLQGCTSVIRKKFSASRYWEECIEHKCTNSNYIGEICRYLLAQPPKPAEKQHRIRIMFGNGLRPSIWNEFVTRFQIKSISEFYGSTEGNANLCNFDNTVGACGFLPLISNILPVIPIMLIKVNEETGERIRDENGLCVKCKPGESGELIGKIIKTSAAQDFTGYLSEKDTKKKQIHDVFTKGDVGFSSGDIVYMDEKGYIFFKDRTGDTFRWKGENVSTTEVESAINKTIGLKDVSVYGVEIPNTDGRAGMAAIMDDNVENDVKSLSENLKDKLPAYARPLFLRFCHTFEITGTHKIKKTQLQKDNYDLAQCGTDKLYYFESSSGSFKPLTAEAYENIKQGRIKF